MTEQRRLAAIVSADVAGYSRLMGRDESGTLAALKALCQEVIDPAIASHGGRIVKTTGDGLLLEFPSVVNAVRCAVEAQTAMADHTAKVPDDRRIAFRIGINLGDIIVEGDDIFGDGVNVAARLQEIATPGGICMSSRVHEDVRDRLDTAFDDGGTQALKNIARPVQVWRWQPGTAVPAKPAPAPTALPLPDKPSIAVLPFQNMSSDPEQDYLADGIVEDIITALSRFRGLFVIARNSTFTYKGKAVDVRQVSLDLGVRYVLEGSIRRGGQRIRLTAQLIDATTRRHIWAESYDRLLEDVFEIQDDVTRAVVAAIAPQIEDVEIGKVLRVRFGSIGAYELALRAWGEARDAYLKSSKTLSHGALQTAKAALAVDNECSLAWATICFCNWHNLMLGAAENVETIYSAALEAGTRAIDLDPANYRAFTFRGMLQYNFGDPRAGLHDVRHAHELNPNDPLTLFCLGYFTSLSGDAATGVEYGELALRLSPRDFTRSIMYSNLALSYCLGRRYDEGVQAAQVALDESPAMATTYGVLALNLVGKGEIEKAKIALNKLRALSPSNLERRLMKGWPAARPEDATRLMTFFRVAAGVDSAGAAETYR
jgi:TolB-like protein/class 3 adenylate cyclase